MNKSDTIGKLAEALAKVQGEIENVQKNHQGYGYMYADLASILEIVRPICSKYELAVTQLCSSKRRFDEVVIDKVTVETVLMHSSGEFISSSLTMPIAGVKGSLAQATGSVISYARRYSLAAMLSISQTDNDAAPKEKEKDKTLYNKLMNLIAEKHLEEKVIGWIEYFKVYSLEELPDCDLQKLIAKIEENN